jgi:hypothetical protein
MARELEAMRPDDPRIIPQISRTSLPVALLNVSPENRRALVSEAAQDQQRRQWPSNTSQRSRFASRYAAVFTLTQPEFGPDL